MSVLKTAVLRQIAYAKSVRSVIRAIMRRMLDGEWINRIFASSDEEFNHRLDEALEERTALGARERRHANAELRNIAEATMKAIDAVGEKVDAVAAKIRRGIRRGKYTEAQIDFCGKAWDSACDIQEIRNSTNTKASYEAAFQFFHRQLAKLGVESVDEFKSIIRAHQARELRRRQREKSAAQTRPKNGIMSSMKNRASSTLALTLAIAGGLAAPLRSDAANYGFISATRYMPDISHFKLMAS